MLSTRDGSERCDPAAVNWRKWDDRERVVLAENAIIKVESRR